MFSEKRVFKMGAFEFICGSLNNHRQIVLQMISRLSTSMSNIKTKDLGETILVAKRKNPQDLQKQIPKH
jgi:hypothetical protein